MQSVPAITKACSQGFTCLRSEDCNFMNSKLLCEKYFRETGKKVTSLLRELKDDVCNAEKKALCCPDAQREETFECPKKERGLKKEGKREI